MASGRGVEGRYDMNQKRFDTRPYPITPNEGGQGARPIDVQKSRPDITYCLVSLRSMRDEVVDMHRAVDAMGGGR